MSKNALFQHICDDINGFLHPFRMSTDTSNVFEETLLFAAGVTTQPTATYFDMHSDMTLKFKLKGIFPNDAKLFSDYLSKKMPGQAIETLTKDEVKPENKCDYTIFIPLNAVHDLLIVGFIEAFQARVANQDPNIEAYKNVHQSILNDFVSKITNHAYLLEKTKLPSEYIEGQLNILLDLLRGNLIRYLTKEDQTSHECLQATYDELKTKLSKSDLITNNIDYQLMMGHLKDYLKITKPLTLDTSAAVNYLQKSRLSFKLFDIQCSKNISPNLFSSTQQRPPRP